MIKAYPGFVNYFEIIKETIVKRDKERPRFHAFLKVIILLPYLSHVIWLFAFSKDVIAECCKDEIHTC